MNFSYLLALYNWMRDSRPKERTIILFLKLLITSIGIIAATVFLVKIYEVPVNLTNIGIRYNTDSIVAKIKLVRDFDLRSRISHDSLFSKWDYGIHSGYILLDVIAYPKDKDSTTTIPRGNMDKTMESALRESLRTQLERKVAYHFVDSVSNLVYIKTHGTWRQTFYFNSSTPFDTIEYHTKCYFNEDTTDCNTWYCTYNKIHSKTPHNYYINERLYGCGGNDRELGASLLYCNSSFDKPNFFMTAEDFSKLIEEIRFDSLSAEEIHQIEIDYKGAAEFGVLTPAPDSITVSSIHYYTPGKISQIARNGLKYQVRLPEMENMQEVRIFFATMVLAGLLGVFFNILYRLLKPCGLNVWHKYPLVLTLGIVIISVISIVLIVYFLNISRPASDTIAIPPKPFTETSY